jgi:putative membrane protein
MAPINDLGTRPPNTRTRVVPAARRIRHETAVFLGAVLLLEIFLGVKPSADRLTWALENFPVWIALILIPLTDRKFPLSQLCLALLTVHAVILAVGGHYTYAKVPLGEWAKGWFGWERNHYDRIGHLAQGFIPAILIRELLLRSARVSRSWWLPVLVVMCCLGVSASYELIEWAAAELTGEAAKDFLGTQGDVWDTQWDMFLAFVGSISSLVILSRWHDSSMLRSLDTPVFLRD